jgi:hypothetical protein
MPQQNSSRSVLDQGVVALLQTDCIAAWKLIHSNLSGRVSGDKNRNPRVRDSDGRAWDPPSPQARKSWSGRPAGSAPFPGPAARGLQRGRGALQGQSQRRFEHAQSVTVRPRPALRDVPSCSRPRHCGYASGASRPSPFLTTQNAHSSKRLSVLHAEAAPGDVLLARGDDRAAGNTQRLASPRRFRQPLPRLAPSVMQHIVDT